MKITFDKKAGDKLANLLCETDDLIKDGTIKVGITGLSPDAAKFCNLFYKGTSGEPLEVIFNDKGLRL